MLTSEGWQLSDFSAPISGVIRTIVCMLERLTPAVTFAEKVRAVR